MTVRIVEPGATPVTFVATCRLERPKSWVNERRMSEESALRELDLLDKFLEMEKDRPEYFLRSRRAEREEILAALRIYERGKLVAARVAVSEAHPDHGGPGGETFQRALERLEDLRSED